MHNTVERRRNPANLPALPTLRDNMSAAGHGRFPFLEDKVLDDIGLSRIDMLYKQPD